MVQSQARRSERIDLTEERVDLLRVPQMGLGRRRGHPQSFYVLRGGASSLTTAEVVHDDIGAATGELESDGPADPARAAGDQSDLAL
jgi:hypothetical protein